MRMDEMKLLWLQEEERSFKGWDFSSLAGRMIEEALPWNYEATVRSYMKDPVTLLDMGTGGGEFLMSLSPPPGRTYATEAYPPNYELCSKVLPAHGIEVRRVFNDESLPFEDHFFDLVINRHEAFSISELRRILKPGGFLVTQQVGGWNNRELSAFLLGSDAAAVDAAFGMRTVSESLRTGGFNVLEAKEAFPELKFLDVGALVYFAKIIEWEFPGFTVEKCLDKLMLLQEKLLRDGSIRSTEHRFFIVAQSSRDI